jgi:hypothetical protein
MRIKGKHFTLNLCFTIQIPVEPVFGQGSGYAPAPTCFTRSLVKDICVLYTTF